jgi:hypothetical protein
VLRAITGGPTVELQVIDERKVMNKQYVENIDGVYRLTDTRVSLDSIVYAFWRGQTAENIAQ